MARYMNEKIPGVDIPEVLVKRIGDAGEDTKQVTEISIEIAASTIKQLKGFCRGVHIMAIGWEDKIPFILDSSGVPTSP